MAERWSLIGHDTFSDEDYPIPGDYSDEQAARQAGAIRFEDLNKTQPPETSGGQGFYGIQDRIFVQRPDGTRYRFIPTTEESEKV